MPLSPNRPSFMQAGGRYQDAQTSFNHFIDALLPLAEQIPSLAFGARNETKIDFRYLGRDCRLRFTFDTDAGVGTVVYMAKVNYNDDNDNRYEDRNVVLIDHIGNIGVNQAWPWLVGRDSERAFYYLLTGQTR
jgi:hypothetical protein